MSFCIFCKFFWTFWNFPFILERVGRNCNYDEEKFYFNIIKNYFHVSENNISFNEILKCQKLLYWNAFIKIVFVLFLIPLFLIIVFFYENVINKVPNNLLMFTYVLTFVYAVITLIVQCVDTLHPSENGKTNELIHFKSHNKIINSDQIANLIITDKYRNKVSYGEKNNVFDIIHIKNQDYLTLNCTINFFRTNENANKFVMWMKYISGVYTIPPYFHTFEQAISKQYNVSTLVFPPV
jgi:hypothetical protein